MASEKEFGAKIDRIAEDVAAMRADTHNLKEYIQAVSSGTARVRDDLAAHKENVEAHGRKGENTAISSVIAWLGLAMAAVLGILEVRRH